MPRLPPGCIPIRPKQPLRLQMETHNEDLQYANPKASIGKQNVESKGFNCGDTIRMPHYPTAGGFRVWKITGVHLGATRQESTYELIPLDASENKPINVPCIILETHPGIERM